MAREIFILNMLDAYIKTTNTDITFARLKEKPPSNIPFFEEKTRESLTQFAENISTQGLNDYMQSFAKVGSSTARDFYLKSIFAARRTPNVGEHGMGMFYLDGDFGLALGANSHVEQGSKIWVGVTSFCLGSGIENYIPQGENPLIGAMPYKYPHPVIVQVQGPSPSAYGYERRPQLYCEALSILQDYKWERALIGLTLDWARKERIPSVYLLPAEKNRWPHSREQMERLEMRYDVSAKRLGFKLQPNGLYATSVA